MWISAGAALFVLPRLPGAVARTAAVSSVGGTDGSAGARDNVETKSSAERGLKKDFVAGSWRPDLPWDELAGSLEGSLQDTGPAKYIEECVAAPGSAGPTWELPDFLRSAWFLVDQPSGVCLPHLFCGLEYCDPKPNTENEPFINRLFGLSEASSDSRNQETGEVLTYSGLDLPVFEAFGIQTVGLSSKVKNWVTNPANPSYDVPPKTIHPRIPSDVVNAVNFARTHGLQVSVKNSGHSYSGSSSKAGTLLLNMRQYMTEMINITSCDGMEDDRFDPCRLASARGKPGYVRVSGGRNWAEVYQAVNDENAALVQGGGDPQYLASGGAAATVSPQGWTWQGGLAGSANGRTNGFGADQVLQIEMVTANGWHVRFAPVEWDIVRTEAAPKTTKVEGECFLNDHWTDCPEPDFPFKDLWKAMRGGGGGYGVVLSSTIQLNPYRPLQWLRLGNINGIFGSFTLGQCQNGLTIPSSPQASSAIGSATLRFKYLSMLDPKKVGLSQTQSVACGTPGFGNIFCYGTYSDGEDGPAEVFLEAWKRYLDYPDVRKPLEDAGIDVDLVKTCNNIDELKDDPTNQALTPYNYEDYAAWLLRNQNTEGPEGTTLPADSPRPDFTTSSFRTMNVVVPKEYIVANIDEAVSLFPSVYSAFGGTGNELADDQCNAVSEAYRGGGDMVLGLFPSEKLIEEYGAASVGLYPLAANDTFYEDYFPRMYDTTDSENFPAFLGSNHYGPDAYGPLKSDWTKACPVEWSRAKRDAESDGMFTCNKCVGDNKAKKKNVPANKPMKNRLASLNSKVTFKDVPATEARSGAAAKGFSWLSAAMCVVWYGWALQW